MSIRSEAHKLALAHIEPDVLAGRNVRDIQISYHGSGGPIYHVEVMPGALVHVTKVNGKRCDELFSLKRLYKECQTRQLSLFDE